MVSRHGNRAPNPEVWELCPGMKPQLDKFKELGIAKAGLTAMGMREMYGVGHFARRRYVEKYDLIPSIYNSDHVVFNAVSEPRTLQSASAMGLGLYPHGSDGSTAPLLTNLLLHY